MARAASFAGVTLLLCAVGLVVSVNTRLARALIADAVNRALSAYFCGQVTVESIGSIGVSAIRGVRLSVIDPDANQVLRLGKLDAHVALLPTLRDLLSNRKVLEVVFAEVAIDQMNLYVQPSGDSLNLQRAFRVCAPPSASGHTVRLAIRKIRVAHLLAHLELTNVPAFDAEFKDVGASLLLIPGKLAIDVERFVIATRGLVNGADIAGAGDFKFVLPFAKPRDVLARTHWAGGVYGTELSVEAQWLAGLLRLGLDAPQLPAQTVRRFWVNFPEGLDASVHTELQGTPPEFAVKARVARGHGVLDVTGQVSIGEPRRAELHVAVDSIDLRQVFALSPQSSISASADVSAQQAQSGPVSGEVRLELPQNSIAGVPTPPASVQASFLHIPGAKSQVDARILARESGAPAQFTCRVTSDGKDANFTFEGSVRAPRLDRVSRLAHVAQGEARAGVQGSLDLARGTLNANVSLNAVGLHRSRLDIERAQMRASLHGPLRSPRMDLDLGATQIALAGVKFSDARLQAHGPLANTRFNAELRGANGARVGLAGWLGLEQTVTLRDLSASFDRGAGAIRAHANTVRVHDGGVVLDALRIEGLGEPLEVSLALAPSKLRLRAIAKGLDLSRVARITQTGNYGGRLDLDTEVSVTPGHADGRVSFSLSDAQMGKVHGWSAQGEASLQDRGFFARLHGDYGAGNWVELQTDAIRLDGPGDELADWQNCTGRVGIDARADITELVRQLPSELIAIGDLHGTLGVRADIARGTDENSPTHVTLSVQGSQLAFSLPGSAVPSRGAAAERGSRPPQFNGIEASLGLAYDSGLDQTRTKLQLSDSTGVLATLDASADGIPLHAVGSPKAQLMSLPFNAQLRVPRRSLKSLPGGFVPERYVGDVESKLVWRGSLVHPDVGLEAHVTQARIPRTLSRPVDLTLVAHYDGLRVDGSLKTILDRSTVFDADLRIDTRFVDWLTERDEVPWEGSMRARLAAFPLESVRVLGNSEVSGVLNGELEIEGLHRDAKANLKLDTRMLRVHDLVLTAGTAQVVLDRDHFDARVRLEENSAYAEARVSGVPKWGKNLVPTIDDSRPERAALSADKFRIAVLLPFASGLLSDLDGRVHAELSAEIDRSEGATRLSGVATVQDGVFELAAGGGEFHDIDATLVFKPDGSVELQSMTAQGVTGHLQLAARTRFDGLGWASTEAHLRIPANSPIPLTLQGAGYGTAFGQIDVLAVRAPNRRDVLMDVDVPSFDVMLPDTIARTVQQLEPMQGVRFGSRKRVGAFEPLPTRRRGSRVATGVTELPAQVKVNLNLGKEVKVARNSSLEVTLTGHPQIELTDSVSMTGQIQLVRGFLDIEGKRFEIEQGTVSFIGDDPTNPQADVTAWWKAPDGTIVYADFAGPLRSGKLALRSEPPLAKNEILALMVFGGTERGASSMATGAQVSGSRVIGVAQGAATQPINHALQDYGLGGVSTRIDTSNVNPRPEVEVRIARDIALQIAWVLGTPPPGSNPDRTLFTIDWQFFRRWALETTVGDAGTSIADVVWQYGY
jgi:translocation and assembly module TamB